jgi:hypothetical protein
MTPAMSSKDGAGTMSPGMIQSFQLLYVSQKETVIFRLTLYRQADLSSHPVLANRQIILASKDGHASWVSTATLAANGPYPRDIDGGVIVRDKATGKPTGTTVFIANVSCQFTLTGVFIDT